MEDSQGFVLTLPSRGITPVQCNLFNACNQGFGFSFVLFCFFTLAQLLCWETFGCPAEPSSSSSVVPPTQLVFSVFIGLENSVVSVMHDESKRVEQRGELWKKRRGNVKNTRKGVFLWGFFLSLQLLYVLCVEHLFLLFEEFMSLY